MSSISVFYISSRRRHTRLQGDWSSDVCSSDLRRREEENRGHGKERGECPRTHRTWTVRPSPRVPCPILTPSLRDEIGRASCRETIVTVARGPLIGEKTTQRVRSIKQECTSPGY